MVSIAVSGFVTCASSLGYLDGIQKKALDFFMWWRGESRTADIVLVAIDDETFEAMGSRQPLPRGQLASLVEFLRQCEPRAIGLDIELKTATMEREDARLRAAIDRKVVLPYDVTLSRDTQTVQVSRMLWHDADVQKGFANTYMDPDGVVRRAPMRLRTGDGTVIESFSAVMFRLLAPGGGSLPESIRIDYAGPAGTFPVFSARPLLALAAQNISPPAENPFRNKIVFIGGTFRASRDFVATPQGGMSGMEAQANILNTLLTDAHIRTPHWSINLVIQVFLSAVFGVLFFVLRPRGSLLIGLGVLLMILVPASYYLYLKTHYWVDFIIPVVAFIMTGSLVDRAERRRIKNAFTSYVSKEVVESVYEDATLLDGRRADVTVLFADIRSFTALSEDLPPEQLSLLLSDYYAFMTKAVLNNGGVVSKFIGDAVMAVYGAPVQQEDHAVSAVGSAQEMLAGLPHLNARLQEQGLPAFAIGIGIHSGPVFAGNIGPEERKEYAVVGDTVNIASRLESMNKQLGTTCLISEETYRKLGHGVKICDKGEISLRGRHQSLKVYALFSEQEEVICG